MKRNLVILFGTTGVGKSSVVESLGKKGYVGLSLDGIIQRLFSKSNNDLNEGEIVRAYNELGQQTSHYLTQKNVVVDEWFYNDNSFDLFFSKIADEEIDVYMFHLKAPLNDVQKRNRMKIEPLPQDTVERHHNLTLNKPGRYYKELGLIEIETGNMSPECVANHILNYIIFQNQMHIQDSLRDY